MQGGKTPLETTGTPDHPLTCLRLKFRACTRWSNRAGARQAFQHPLMSRTGMDTRQSSNAAWQSLPQQHGASCGLQVLSASCQLWVCAQRRWLCRCGFAIADCCSLTSLVGLLPARLCMASLNERLVHDQPLQAPPHAAGHSQASAEVGEDKRLVWSVLLNCQSWQMAG